jgi:phosphate starvation-inducible membrane PsiE
MEIICQVPEANDTINYHEFNREGLGKVLYVIKNEIGIGNFIWSGGKKLGAFFGLYRPYYSWKNNLFLMLFYIFYPFALVGIFTKQLPGFYYIKLFSILYISVTAMLIFVTCDEWSNRFIAPVFPFILLLAVAGFVSVKNYFKKKEEVNSIN